MLNHKALKSLLKERNMKQLKLAKMANIPANTLSRYVQGVCQPKADRVKALARVLGVPLESIIVKEAAADAALVPKPGARQICFCPFCGERLIE
jgi:transcriptional regulator with XRE-family HTH domain